MLDCPHANGAVTFSPDGRHLIASTGDAVRLWTPWATDEKLTLPGHLGGIPGIAVNREGTLLASAGKDRTVRIWDARSGRPLKTLTDFRGPVQAVAFGPDAGRLVTAEFNGELRIWDLAAARSESLPDPGLGRPLWSIEFTPDGRHFWAQGSPQAAVWRVARDGGSARGDPSAATLEFARILPDIFGGCLSPDGQRVASSSKGQLVVLDVPDARPIFSVPYTYPGGARHLAFGPAGNRLVSINRRYEIEVWDTTTGQKTATFGGDPARASNSTIALTRRRPMAGGSESGRDDLGRVAWQPGLPPARDEQQHLEPGLDPGTEPAGRRDVRRRTRDLGPGPGPRVARQPGPRSLRVPGGIGPGFSSRGDYHVEIVSEIGWNICANRRLFEVPAKSPTTFRKAGRIADTRTPRRTPLTNGTGLTGRASPVAGPHFPRDHRSIFRTPRDPFTILTPVPSANHV